MIRVGAVQIWPEWNAHVDTSWGTTLLRSASSNTRPAPLPPSSSSSRFIEPPATAPIAWPTPVEPVKLTMSVWGLATIASPTSGPEPVTMLTTPGGKPTPSRISTSRMTASGSCGAGLTTTVLPMASAGPTLPAQLTAGKL